MKGMVFEEDTLKGLQRVLHEFYKTHPYEPKKVEVGSRVHSLTSLPAGDCNYQTALREASKDEIRQAIEIMNENPAGNKTRISLCEKALNGTGRRGRPKKELSEKLSTSATVSGEVKEKKDNIIQFPTAKPEIVPLPKSDGSHTYDECEQKLNKEREIFKDQDSAYVIDGLLELCKVNADFRNNVMRDDKSYAFKYFADKARGGYAVKYEGVAYLDNNLALGLAMDYFNADEEAMKPKPAPKAKTTKRGRKRKGA